MSLLDGYQIVNIIPNHIKYKRYSGNGGKSGRADGHTNKLPGGSGCYRYGDCFTCPIDPEECDGGEKVRRVDK